MHCLIALIAGLYWAEIDAYTIDALMRDVSNILGPGDDYTD